MSNNFLKNSSESAVYLRSKVEELKAANIVQRGKAGMELGTDLARLSLFLFQRLEKLEIQVQNLKSNNDN